MIQVNWSGTWIGFHLSTCFSKANLNHTRVHNIRIRKVSIITETRTLKLNGCKCVGKLISGAQLIQLLIMLSENVKTCNTAPSYLLWMLVQNFKLCWKCHQNYAKFLKLYEAPMALLAAGNFHNITTCYLDPLFMPWQTFALHLCKPLGTLKN